MTRTSAWVKIPKLCHNTPLSIFSLGKGRESLCLKPYIKLITSALSDLPPAHNDLDKASMMHLKIAQNMYIFSRKFCTFPVTEENEIQHIYFQFMTPAKKLTHNTKFKHFWMQKDTNFRNTIIIHHLGPENRQKSNPERHKFRENALIDPSKYAHK